MNGAYLGENSVCLLAEIVADYLFMQEGKKIFLLTPVLAWYGSVEGLGQSRHGARNNGLDDGTSPVDGIGPGILGRLEIIILQVGKCLEGVL